MAQQRATQPTPEEEAAAKAQALADAQARVVAGAPPAKADTAALAGAPVGKAGDGTRFAVLHGAVGEWPQGTIVTGKQLHEAGVDDTRLGQLVEAGAIAEYTDKE